MLSLNNVRRLLAEQSEHVSTNAVIPDDDDGFGQELSELNAIETRLSEELAQFRLFYQSDSESMDDETCTVAIDDSNRSLSSADFSYSLEDEDVSIAAPTSSTTYFLPRCNAAPMVTPSPRGINERDCLMDTVVLDIRPSQQNNAMYETGSKRKASRRMYLDAVRELQDFSSPKNTHVFDPIQPRRRRTIQRSAIQCQGRRHSESVKELLDISYQPSTSNLDSTAATEKTSARSVMGEADQDGKDVAHYVESLSRALAYLKQADRNKKVQLDENRLIAAIAYLRLRNGFSGNNSCYGDMKGILSCFAGLAFDRHEYKTRALFYNGKLWDGEFVRTVEGTVCIYIAASIVAATSFDHRSAMHVWTLLCLPPLVTILATATPHKEDEVSVALSALCLKAIGNAVCKRLIDS